MNEPKIFEPYQAAADIDILPSYFPIPGLGILPVNAFVIKASQPIMVDSGLVPLSKEFMEKLSSVIDIADLRWLWLTHADQDHIGSLKQILQASPKLRIITTFLTAGKMSLFDPLPMDKLFFLNPGQSIDVGDRTLIAIKPPSFDAPETTGFFDPKDTAFYSSDCFGALMSEPADTANDIELEKLQKGMKRWATVDAPWLHNIDRRKFDNNLKQITDLSPKLILSAHLPVAYDISGELIECLRSVPDTEPFVGPDQQAFELMLAEMT